MARLTIKDWKKLTSAIKFKGEIPRNMTRWKLGDRKAKAKASAWTKKLGDKAKES